MFNNSMINKRINELRNILKQHNYSGYIITTSDEYLSEYTPNYAKRLEYITGFTGSNGLAIILKDTVLFFTDGRYISQSSTELDKKTFEIFDQQSLQNFPWEKYITQDDIIAYDSKIFSRNSLHRFSKINIQPYENNLIDQIWIDQPRHPNSNIYDYSIDFAGEDYLNKIAKCRQFIQNNNASSLIITNSDSVCWLLNIRAHDLEYSPLLLAHAIVTDKDIYLFTDKIRYSGKKNIIILPEYEFENIVIGLSGKLLYDKNFCSDYVAKLIEQKECANISNPCIHWKAVKNSVEISHIQQAHIQDAVAVCEMLAFIDSEDISQLSEYDLGHKLTKFRKNGKLYIMDSFPSICGFQDNGAIIHYKAEQETAKKIQGDGLLLIDSGGQYLGATTDITRTVQIGSSTEEHKKNYTNVLKGHIALASSIFPKNKVTGANLDVLARQFLWNNGKDYAHGTGHGVGSFLSVHEGPHSISLVATGTKIESGMVMSNEPGYYVPGKFGIRIENMMYAKDSKHPDYLEFKALTLVPYSKDLINIKMLNKNEIEYIDKYYKRINKLVTPLLSDNAKNWLNKQHL